MMVLPKLKMHEKNTNWNLIFVNFALFVSLIEALCLHKILNRKTRGIQTHSYPH